MNKQLTVLATSAVLLLVGASSALAAPHQPGGGPDFGQHVAGMAPEHPREHGAMFGACVSTMAKTGECPHHQP